MREANERTTSWIMPGLNLRTVETTIDANGGKLHAAKQVRQRKITDVASFPVFIFLSS